MSNDNEAEDKYFNILKNELENQGYHVFSKQQIEETLRDDFEVFKPENTEFKDWIEPIDLDKLEDDKKYVVDSEMSFAPVLVNPLIDERYEQDKLIDKDINDYLNNVIITNKGVENVTEIDPKLSFYSFDDLEDYLSIEPIENFNEAYDKISNQNVEVDSPFIELAIGSSEVYINNNDLKTEKDILDFLNNNFEKHGIDIEAKSFNRQPEEISSQKEQKQAYIHQMGIER